MKPDLNTPFSLLFPEVILVWVWLSLIGICFLRRERGDLFPGAFSICAQSSHFNAIFHYTMMALTFERAVVSGYGNRAINLNSSSALECGVTAWTFHMKNPSHYCKKKVGPSFSSLLWITQYLSYLQPGSFPADKGEIWDSSSHWVHFLGSFSTTRISFDTGVPERATWQTSGYLKCFMSTVTHHLRSQQCRTRSCWVCSLLRRVSSQQMRWSTSPFVFPSFS